MSQTIRWSWTHEYPSRKEALQEILSLSGQWLKKHQINKEWLSQPCIIGEEMSLPIEVINKGMINPQFAGEQPIILSEDANFLALHKPNKMHGHPLSYLDDENILSYLRSKNMFSYLEVNKQQHEKGLLYRLDFETSGLLLLTSKEEIYQEVRENYSEMMKQKYYLAIVRGKASDQKLSHYLTAVQSKGEKMKVTELICDDSSQLGELSFKELSYNKEKDVSLIAVSLKTGLRHQIRAQLSHIGHPILGDELYGGDQYERLFLHCFFYELNFRNQQFKFEDSNLGSFDVFFNLDSSLQMLRNQILRGNAS